MGVPVILNVYDLAAQNSYTYWCGVGVFHTGVEVYGIEYAYGGHEYDMSGIFATNPREAPGAVIFRESITMGETTLSQAEVQQVVMKMGQQYKGNKYHLLQKNCNHFASDLCSKLVGKSAPIWINRLAGLAILLHCLLPTAWVPPLQTPSMLPDLPSAGSARRRNGGREDKQTLISSPTSDSYMDPPRLPLSATRV